MVSNQNLHALGSPPPNIVCQYCFRHFRSRGGHTKHMRARHRAESGLPEPNPSVPLSHIPYPSSHPPSPIPSNYTPPPLHGGIEIASLNSDAEDDLDVAPGMRHPQVPDASSITRSYHPKLDGRICDESGNNIPLDTPPRRDSDKGSDDWTPYNNRLEFEVADFLFRRNQMSAGDIDFLLGLWAASLAIHDDKPPFSNAQHLHDTIDLTPLGDVTWESFTFLYNGHRPVENTPPWMEAKYNVWFRDPRTLVHNLLSNPDFKSGFDYAPFQERTAVGVHRFQDFMSGNWAWNQADIIAKDPQTHGSVLCPIILGNDKTTVSVGTGNNEYWPIYLSIGNIRNSIRQAHPNGVVLLGFFAIPKSTPECRDGVAFRKFRRQLVHSSLAKILESLEPGMTTPEVVRFPDGHFRKVIYGFGPYIADYPEQALLACIVQGWCPKCTAPATDLDSKRCVRRSQAHTELLVEGFELGTLWDEYGLIGDVVPFTTYFPRADIHESLSPDLLHQLKGCFKGHLVTWVTEYIKAEHPAAEAQMILDDIDRVALAPSSAGLRYFHQGRDFKQWTRDDSKALVKVYLPAIQDHVPDEMVQMMHAFLEFCYIARSDVHDTNSLAKLDNALQRFHRYREIFRTNDVRVDGFDLPRQHSLIHYAKLIRAFGALNGLCSSITESKHIKTVKESWRHSSCSEAFSQMLLTNQRLDKLAAARVDFADRGMLQGTLRPDEANPDLSDDGLNRNAISNTVSNNSSNEDNGDGDKGDGGDEDGDSDAVDGPTVEAHIVLAKSSLCRVHPEAIAAEIGQPEFLDLIRQFIYDQQHSDDVSNASIPDLPKFYGKITIYTSALVTFHVPSDISGIGGMRRERIRAVKSWRNGPGRYDTIFVNTDSSTDGMRGIGVARVRLFFTFSRFFVKYPCALVHWYSRVGDSPDDRTGMWVVQPDDDGSPPSVIHLDSIVRAAHLIPVVGPERVSTTLSFRDNLDRFTRFYVKF